MDSLDVPDHLHIRATTTSLILLTTSTFHLTMPPSPPNGSATTSAPPRLNLDDDHLCFTTFAKQRHHELLLCLIEPLLVHEHLAKSDATTPSTLPLGAPLARVAPSTVMTPPATPAYVRGLPYLYFIDAEQHRHLTDKLLSYHR